MKSKFKKQNQLQNHKNSISEVELKKILKHDPDRLQENKSLGSLLANNNQFAESLQYLSKAVLLEQNAENYYNLGVALHGLKQLEDALTMYLEAIKLNPYLSIGYSNLGAIYMNLHDFDKALVFYQKCIALNPQNFDDYLNYALIHVNKKQYEDALSICNLVIFSEGENIKNLSIKMGILNILDQEDESSKVLKRMSEIDSKNAETQWSHAQKYLLNGDYQKGWSAFESRWSAITGLEESIFDQPKWLGDFSIDNKTLLVHSEQGLGDSLQFCRFLSKLKSTNAKIIFHVPKELKKLLANIDGAHEVITDEDSLPPFDCHIPLMSLPLVFETNLENIPNHVPYIFADSGQKKLWHEKIQSLNNNWLNVGLIWSGGYRADEPNLFALNERRNMSIDHLKFLTGLNVNFFSLQKGNPAETELLELTRSGWDGPNLINYVNELNDFSDTAALLDNLDLVISVDTSTAHLAAAMGK
jgi:tetratricopeptide (TPR) repeat protein